MDQIEKAKRLLESKGFKVRESKKTVAKTFQVSEYVLTEFLQVCTTKKMKIRSAVDEALEEWTKKAKK
jgi:hypothetical protein